MVDQCGMDGRQRLKIKEVFYYSNESIYKLQFVKIMKTNTLASTANRSTSNSTEASRLKKSASSGFSAKLKSSINNSSNENGYSIKQGRVNTSSKSNKKSNSQSSHSNKSFKVLSQLSTHNNMDSNKKTILSKPQPQVAPTEKKTTIPVKNIKAKALGQSINQSNLINSYKANTKKTEDKENQVDILKKSTHKIDKKLFMQESQSRRNNRDLTEPSLFNFSCMLVPRQSQQLALSQFQVGRKLGKGRFGDVYMARDLRTGFILAIKMIAKKQVKQAGMQTQLAQQIKVQLFTNHPNVLKMYGFFSDQNKIYLLLQLATHGCLFKEIRKRNYCQQSLASFYFRQISGAVRYLHSNFVIHRDIKPQNILNCFNVLKLCDFGWAAYSPLYQRQTFCGTLDYVPPQIVTGEFYDQRADVWCLGVLCYELCTGRAPFQSKTDQNQTYDKILKVDIEFPIYLSGQVVDFIGKILNREPIKRMSLGQVQSHSWMRKYENEPGRMIPKQIWECWTKLSQVQ